MISSLRQLSAATEMLLRTWMRDLGLVLGFAIIFPIGFLFFLGILVQPALRVQVLVGSIMMEMALLNINVVAQSIGQDKFSKMYDLWVSFPLSPSVYVLSLALAFLPFSLLSAGFTFAVGVEYFHLTFGAGIVPILLLGFVLVWASTLGVGFLVAVYARTPREINMVAQLVGIVLTFFAPIFYPVTILPLPLRAVAYAWPLTWGSILLGAIGHSDFSGAAVPAAVLGAYTVLWFAIIAAGLRWRQS